MVAPITEEAKAAMLANFDLEISARKEKLRAMCEAQCASLRSRLERRVNRVPATKRQMPLIELLAPPPPPAKAVPAPVKAPAKKASAPALAPPPARKTRAAPATTTSRPATAKEAPKPAPKPASKHTYSKSAPKASTMTRGKKRSSDEIAGEDKENASADLAVSKKRVRAATTTTKQPVVSKPTAPAARSTRAASRKTAPAEVLSPKNNNSRAKPATRSVRPR
ncbi:hypothetical protein EKO04_002524 [Ascochyta lentis]|uniref:Borealin N-terminal domain-containing protein n=1 Tax=Ascochyta lentis TaxID=205686 RepID=A0A8H7JCF1_9PLEO|nr:hypothetical protein EKO04_002524 [Ascochyta lentis]